MQQGEQVEFLPHGGADEGKKARESVLPAALAGLKADEQIGQQGGPDLPAHGVGAVAEEVGELEVLFDLLEENFYRPARFVK